MQNMLKWGTSEVRQTPFFEISNFSVTFRGVAGSDLRAVNRVSLKLAPGNVHGLVGESGSGKTVLAHSALRLINAKIAITEGSVRWRGRELLNMHERELNRVRGTEIAMIFQNAAGSLNPARRVGAQIITLLRYKLGLGRKAAETEAEHLLAQVHLSEVSRVLRAYPAELSGGMAQRVAIALALAMRPTMIIADEPTSALDVTVAAGILDLFENLQRDLNLSLLIISHDLGIIGRLADYISVIYRGVIMEQGPANLVLSQPAHPYSQLLRAATSQLHQRSPNNSEVDGTNYSQRVVKDTNSVGCSFYPRCPHAMARCETERPTAVSTDSGGDDWKVACWLYNE